jgi:hypothetical protein
MTPTRSFKRSKAAWPVALGVRREARFCDIEALREAMKVLHLQVVQILRTFDRLHVDREASRSARTRSFAFLIA